MASHPFPLLLNRPAARSSVVFLFAFGLVCAALAPSRALALAGDHNDEPELCQGIGGAAYVVNSIGATVLPPPAGTAADVLAYGANLNLKLCPPQIVAPPPIYGVEPDPDNACVHSFTQPHTEAQYENILGIPFLLKYPGDWGELGRPTVYHFNTDVAVDLVGYQSVGGKVEVPVGRNSLLWRANTLVNVMDIVNVPVPFFASGSEAKEQLVKKTPPLREGTKAALRAFARAAGKELVSTVVEEGVVYTFDELIELFFDNGFTHSQLGLFDDIDNFDSQAVWVYDRVAPVISSNTDNNSFSPELGAILNYDASAGDYVLEAFQPGGVNADRAVDIARGLLSYSDACDTRLSLTHDAVPELWSIGDEVTITWTVTDPGPVREPVIIGDVAINDGGRNSAQVSQTFRVEDTNPPILLAPPSKVVESAGGSVDVNLGSPRVFDLADLDPDIDNDYDGSPFALGLHQVTWTATDLGGNESSAVQLINVKQQGSNLAPDADGQSVAATSFQPVDILLTAFDADFHPGVGRYDPLTFTIVEAPENGFFIAPLLPFFIEDFRLEAATIDYVYNDSPTTEAERWGSLQADTAQACEDNLDSLLLPALINRWDLEYPYLPEWMTVDDAGNSYVYDSGRLRCDASNDDIHTARIVSFDADGELIQARQLTDSPDDFSVDNFTGRLLVLDAKTPFDNYINAFVRDEPNFGVPDGETPSGLRVRDPSFGMQTARALVQDHQGVLYVQGSPDIIRAYRPDWGIYGTSQDDVDVYIGTVPEVPRDPGIFDITVDSDNNLYMVHWSRIFKFSAGSFDENGDFTPPQLLGWMGKCLGNLTNVVACDVNNQRSIGFKCTDTLCERDLAALGGADRGAEPGQFAGVVAIVFDPNDILYVADAGNDRIQRFTPEGYFAGQAKSTGQGWGFILGDFGDFDSISVNSEHFYLLDRNDPLGGSSGLLHVFKTTPITPVDDASARVTYQSNNNFVGTDDFVFGVTDGLDSDQATVFVNVERDYRPPTIPLPPGDQVVDEDGVLSITLTASDPDEQLDTLSYEIVDPPAHGSIEIVDDELTYRPFDDFAGEDSFSFAAFDGRFYSEPATVAVTVDPVPDAPVVTLAAPESAGVGFELALEVTVFDPDAGADHAVTILWGDGDATIEGQILVDGVAVSEVPFDPDGSLPDDIDTTGPIYTRGGNGYGTMLGSHAYSAAGDYQMQVCAVDQSPAATICEFFDISIEPRVAYDMSAEPDVDEVDAGGAFGFSVTLANKPFDTPPTDGSQGQDDSGVVISGELSRELLNPRHPAGYGGPTCDFAAAGFSCDIGDMPYDSSVALDFEVDVDPLAPGRARLSVATEAAGTVPVHAAARAGVQVEVVAGDDAPQLVSLTPDGGSTEQGIEVSLNGADFQAGAAVYFGNRLASLVRVESSQTISVLAPLQEAGLVDVVVINPDHRSDRLAEAFAYRDPVPPTGGGGGGGTQSGGSGFAPGSLALGLLLLALAGARRRPGRAPYRRPGRGWQFAAERL